MNKSDLIHLHKPPPLMIAVSCLVVPTAELADMEIRACRRVEGSEIAHATQAAGCLQKPPRVGFLHPSPDARRYRL